MVMNDKHEHLNALNMRLSNERNRMLSAKSPAEFRLRGVWVEQIEAEIAHERHISGLGVVPDVLDMTDDELLAELAEVTA